MAKATSQYVCQNCGARTPRWAGRCETCGTWNQIVEEPAEAGPHAAKPRSGSKRIAFETLGGGSAEAAERRPSGIGELDRVLGGGLATGSAVLIGGDPGIGKSTLLLQVVCALAGHMHCVYISGEELVDQVRQRARRLGLAEANVGLAAATDVRDILAVLDAAGGPAVAVIDSIQTMYLDALESAPGTVSQVRACAAELIRVAKRRGTSLFLVGHVTKDGAIAGPRVLEHMVDTVLYFEGERGHPFRILRAVKNRFGPTDEIGVFAMTDAGLAEVPNPSELFLADRAAAASGSAVFAGLEGTRPLLVEIQALVGPPALGSPRRAVVGWDSARLAMVLAVLEARCGIAIGGRDIYLNVAGGLRVGEPAADLAVAAALLSSLSGAPVAQGTVVFGEIGLSGEVRAVAHADLRLKEAARLGFGAALAPKPRGPASPGLNGALVLRQIGHLTELAPLFVG